MNICLGSYETLFQNLKMCWRMFSLFLSLRRFFFFLAAPKQESNPRPQHWKSGVNHWISREIFLLEFP